MNLRIVCDHLNMTYLDTPSVRAPRYGERGCSATVYPTVSGNEIKRGAPYPSVVMAGSMRELDFAYLAFRSSALSQKIGRPQSPMLGRALSNRRHASHKK